MNQPFPLEVLLELLVLLEAVVVPFDAEEVLLELLVLLEADAVPFEAEEVLLLVLFRVGIENNVELV